MRPTQFHRQNPSQGQKCLYFFGVPRTAVSNPKIAHRNGHLTVSCLLPTKLAFISFPKLLCIWYWSYFAHNCSVGKISQNFINCWNSLNSTGAINFPGQTFQNIPQTADKPVRKTDFHRQSWSERAAQIFVFSERTLFTLYVWPGRIVDEQTRHAGITYCADRSESKPQMTREITHHGSRVDVWWGKNWLAESLITFEVGGLQIEKWINCWENKQDKTNTKMKKIKQTKKLQEKIKKKKL